jgi:uncharacterized protein YcsI (UPF0317 family)
MSTNTPPASSFNTGQLARAAIRSKQWTSPTGGMAPGYVQANLAILPERYAFDFLRFCLRNPKPCPVLDVTDPGSPHPSATWADDADLRTDIPRYRLFRDGEVVEEMTEIASHWREDAVAFLLGCSFTFEQALLDAGLPVRPLEQDTLVPVYQTNVACQPVGIFQGPLVVSMRPIPGHLVARAVVVTARYPFAHGAPVHVGDPSALGIADLNRTDYGEPVRMEPGDVPLFWACGVTPQAVAQAARVPWMITHAPGHMFITDRTADQASLG